MKKIIFVFLLPFLLIACGQVTTVSTSPYEPILINAESGKTMMENNPDIILVDVRTEAEYIDNHIPGAILLTLDQISAKAGQVIPDKNKLYIVYCHTGNRSAQAASLLSSLGYAFVYDMGGIDDWPYDTVSGS